MITTNNSKTIFSKALESIPGGVNSPVRAFRAVGGNPLFIDHAKGPYLYDVDGNRFIELINSWGPMILGHANELIEKAVVDAIKKSPSFGAPSEMEVKMAELIVEMVPSVEMVRMVNSGTEATMSAVRLARGFTGRDKIIKFEGCYHGHGDSFLIAAGSGAATMGIPDSPGVTAGTALDTLTAPFNDIAAVKQLIDAYQGQIAAIIIEPVVGNMGCVLPKVGFLSALRDICTNNGIIYIFDEVMTGFRLSPGGAQQLFGIEPDLTTMGKIIGGGLPVGAYGGKKEIMKHVAPAGPVYQAGTLSGNPIAMSAGYAMLTYLKNNPAVYDQLESITLSIEAGFRRNHANRGRNFTINRIGSMISLFFTENPVTDFASAKTSDTALFARYFNAMLENGVYLAPSQFESLFISAAISPAIAEEIVSAHDKALNSIL
ncbi:MAG: glutamate-1-semialdehyde 2,1-aminomutase [Cyclobacteriaceae bacterium]|nr:glutamate-1-semialdehyde 2,1-aminomutase [Cyclobacteriaceae bacterium]